MRKELIEIEAIENYLTGKMNPKEKANFDDKINNDPSLKSKVEAQEQVMNAIEKMALKKSVKESYQSYKMKVLLTKVILVITSLAMAGFIALQFANNSEEYSETSAIIELTDSLTIQANLDLDENTFLIKTSKDTIIENQDGVIIYIPANAFETDIDEVELKVQSAIDGADIMLAGLSTMSDHNELETGGMFYIDALADGKRVNIIKDITVNVPTDQKVEGMMHYQGEKTASGDIDWVKPVAIAKDLIPVDILSLDFYPPNYEDTLKQWGYSGKQFTDSLYYYFAFGTEELVVTEVKDLISEKEPLIFDYFDSQLPTADTFQNSVHDFISWNFTSKKLGNNIFQIDMVVDQKDGWHINSQTQPEGGVSYPAEFVFNSKQKFKLIGKTREYGVMHHESPRLESFFPGKKARFSQKIEIFENCQLNIDFSFMACKEACYPPTYGTYTIDLKKIDQGVNPTSIKTIWNREFNKTILSTREFQERIPFIHESCDQAVLDLYINNLDKGLSEIDSMVLKLVSGELKNRFLIFAARGDGKVKLSDNATSKLSSYYATKLAMETKAIEKTKNDFWNEQRELDNEHQAKRNESTSRNISNKWDVFNKEYQKNLCKVYDELDIPYDCERPSRSIAKAYYTLPVRSLGWHNIDRQVYAATANRTSSNFSYKGKTSNLTYTQWQLEVVDYDIYEKVYVYNLPQAFNSYVKIKSKGNGKYQYKLNADIDYETLVLAWKDDQFFYSQTKTNPGSETIKLKSISKEKFKQKLSKRNANFNSIEKELEFIQFEQKDAKRIKNNAQKRELRSKIEPVIFPCRPYSKSNETLEIF